MKTARELAHAGSACALDWDNVGMHDDECDRITYVIQARDAEHAKAMNETIELGKAIARRESDALQALKLARVGLAVILKHLSATDRRMVDVDIAEQAATSALAAMAKLVPHE